MKRFVTLLFSSVLVVACSSSSTANPAPPPDVGDGGGGTGVEAGTGGSQCTAAREATLKPIDKVSTAAVSVVSEEADSKLLYVDGSGGGAQNASRSPRVYVNLETGSLVAVTDKSSLESTEWDLSFKRTVIYTNGGDGGPGQGAAAFVAKSFDDVTAADGTNPKQERFFDEECNAQVDEANFLVTTLSPDWYEYDTATNAVTPRDVTFVVVGGTGKRYKVAITSFTGRPDGTTTAPSGGYFLLRVAPL